VIHKAVPSEVVELIFAFLDCRALGASIRVCKQWKEMLDKLENRLWERCILR